MNVRNGCDLMPFAFIQIADVPHRIRFSIQSLLELELLFNKPLWAMINQAFANSLSEEEKKHILWLGLEEVSHKDLTRLLELISREETLRVYKQSQFELVRSIGEEVLYTDEGEPVGLAPRTKRRNKRVDVRDVEPRSQELPDTFSQWYERTLTNMFQIGTTIPISELLQMTPIELNAYLDCHNDRLHYFRKVRVAQAYHTAAFMNGKDTPPLEVILRKMDHEAGRPMESKYTEKEAQKVIKTDQQRTAGVLEKLGFNPDGTSKTKAATDKRDQAKTSADGEKTKKGETKWKMKAQPAEPVRKPTRKGGSTGSAKP